MILHTESNFTIILLFKKNFHLCFLKVSIRWMWQQKAEKCKPIIKHCAVWYLEVIVDGEEAVDEELQPLQNKKVCRSIQRSMPTLHGNSSMLAQQILCVPRLCSVTQTYARKNLWTFYVDHHVTFKRSKLTQVRALETDTSKKQQQQQKTVSSKYIKSCFAVLTNYCEKYKSCKLEAIKIKNKAFAVLQKAK